jgi:hypothetical protein
MCVKERGSVRGEKGETKARRAQGYGKETTRRWRWR